MVRRDNVVQSAFLTVAIGGIDLYRNGPSWGAVVAIAFVFVIALALATLRSLCFGGRRALRGGWSERRRARSLRSDFPADSGSDDPSSWKADR
ncbi:hypothetical protein SAMN05216267_102062 [Actinacidiphila rubida]|uniref:Uncharacterized protein n=1 Tax=Actinacidiphila rubida TaxID=310780 RepID=A0A1H8MXI5_9ACTN|nr:hypothetical protein [Actinacidiphila rubida]SEO21990.1 hypothetical protein SAMN05216267_102062 [Actinacidiphila rubida]